MILSLLIFSLVLDEGFELSLSNLKVVWFPANCNSVMQQLDQDIILATKSNYRHLLCQFLISLIDAEQQIDLVCFAFRSACPLNTFFICTDSASPASTPVRRPNLLRKLCHQPLEAVNFSRASIFKREHVSALQSLYSCTTLTAIAFAFSFNNATETGTPSALLCLFVFFFSELFGFRLECLVALFGPLRERHTDTQSLHHHSRVEWRCGLSPSDRHASLQYESLSRLVVRFFFLLFFCYHSVPL